MSKLTITKPIIGKPDSTEDPKIVTAYDTLETWANGNIDSTNIKNEGVENASIKKETLEENRCDAELKAILAEKGTGLVFTNKYTTKTYTTAEAKAGITPSATRSAIVTLVSYLVTGGPLSATFKVGAGAARRREAVAWSTPPIHALFPRRCSSPLHPRPPCVPRCA